MKPLLPIKGHLENADIILNHNNKICNDHELAKVFAKKIALVLLKN